MHRNGHNPALRVLLSGPAADEMAASLADQPAIAVMRPGTDGHGMRAPSVDVALHVVEDSASAELLGDIRLLRTLSEAPLILAAYGEPNGIVETGLEVGAADVLVLPQSPETLLFALRKAAIAADDGGHGKVVTVFSPKGGSGKTVLATNLAVAAARSGIETLLIDLDLQFGDGALLLSVPPRATIADLAASSGTVDSEKLKAFVYTDPNSNLDVLPAPARPEEAEVVGQTELGTILDAARNAYDAVVIDTGPLFDSAMLAALDRSDQLLLVCNPEVTSLKNVRIGLETIDQLGFPRDRVAVVANRLGAAGAVERGEIEDALGTKIAFDLPDDPNVPASVNRATPVVLAKDGSRFARAVVKLSATVFADAAAPENGRSRRRLLARGRR
jgi:pilus assembly protein CpaE